jgi:hypothetical protein
VTTNVRAPPLGLPGNHKITWDIVEWPSYRALIAVKVQVDTRHFRAVAKIGLHYALAQFPELVGDKPAFGRLGEFILNGGTREPFVRQVRGHFIAEFRWGGPACWTHFPTVERADGWLVFRAYFFAGPEFVLPPYVVRLGRDPSPILRPSVIAAHAFVYDRAPEGFDGRMVPLSLARLVEPITN